MRDLSKVDLAVYVIQVDAASIEIFRESFCKADHISQILGCRRDRGAARLVPPRDHRAPVRIKVVACWLIRAIKDHRRKRGGRLEPDESNLTVEHEVPIGGRQLAAIEQQRLDQYSARD